MYNFHEIPCKGLQGVDVSKVISLREYGFAFHLLPRKGIYRFYIGSGVAENEFGGTEYCEWSVLELPIDTDILDEYSFISVKELADYSGLTLDEWNNQELNDKLWCAVSYYGYNNFV